MTQHEAVSLSVVVPAFNEAQRIDKTLRSAIDYLARRRPDFELIVVDDGSTDDTREIVERYVAEDPRVRLLALGKNHGKGAAVRTGVLDARGDRILFMDADLATPMQELEKLQGVLDRGIDVAFGSRGLPNSRVRRSQGKIRENMGRTFNVIVRAIVLDGIHDTQCGFKLFTREAARALFSRASVDRFAFDVELLLIARELGLRIEEVGIEWFHDPQSRVSPITDATRMLVDVLTLKAKRLAARRRSS